MAKKKPAHHDVNTSEAQEHVLVSSDTDKVPVEKVQPAKKRGGRKSPGEENTSTTIDTSSSPETQVNPRSQVQPQEQLDDLGKVCKEIVDLARQRTIVIKSRLMQANRLQSIIAHDALGYNPQNSEKQRKEVFKKATELINEVVAGKDHKLKPIIVATMQGIQTFDNTESQIAKQMRAWGRKLPKKILDWLNHPHQNGCSLEYLTVIIGETGDLRKYPAPGKVWKRMGTTPKDFQGRKYSGSTLRIGAYYLKDGKQEKVPSLPKEEWESFGYCPRRRSVAYILGENLVRQNYTTVKKTASNPSDTSNVSSSSDRIDASSNGVSESNEPGLDHDSSRSSVTSEEVEVVNRLSTNLETSADRETLLSESDRLSVSSPAESSTTYDRQGASDTVEVSACSGATGGVGSENSVASERIPGPYRLRYEECRDRMSREQPGYAERRYHRNGMLRATNMFLRNLWVVWNS